MLLIYAPFYAPLTSAYSLIHDVSRLDWVCIYNVTTKIWYVVYADLA